jgi:predicted amidohydrolase YtcJ
LSVEKADLILTNAKIVTCEAGQSAVQALAVKGDKILWLGSNSEAQQFRAERTINVDCLGKTVIPGFVDAHCHVMAQVRNLFSLELSPDRVSSIPDIQEALKTKLRFTPPGRWISGSDYNEFYLAEKRHPTRFDLDRATPQNPVILIHRSMHACVLNSLAMQLVGIDVESEEPAGGMIERDLESGQPNGIFYEMLDYLKARIDFSLSEREVDWGVREINRYFLSSGITSLTDATASNDQERWQAFQRMKGGLLQSRINMMLSFQAVSDFSKAGISFGAGDENLRLGSVKIVLSETRGQLHPTQSVLNEMAVEVQRLGYQLAIHAVDQEAVEAAILALEHAQRVSPGKNRRHRIEHCSECPPHLIRRLRKLDAVVVSQPPFLYFSGERYLSQVSPKILPWLYPFRSWLEAGLTVAGSSDAPVVAANPLVGICAAVTRQAESGEIVRPEQAVGVQDALQMYTLKAAYSTFEEDIKGSLRAGKLADLIMVDNDPLSSEPEKIKDIRVEMTMIGGKIVWERS